MAIKLAPGVSLPTNDGGDIRQGKNYSGASWQGNVGTNPGFLSGRAALRARGQVKGKSNPLLGACKSRDSATGHLLYDLPRLADIQAFKRWRAKQEAKAAQNGTTQTET